MLCHHQHKSPTLWSKMAAPAPAITSAFRLVGRGGGGEVKGIVLLFKSITQYHFCLYLASRKAEKREHLSKTWEFFH